MLRKWAVELFTIISLYSL